MAKMPPWAQPPAAPELRQRLWELGLQHHQKALEGGLLDWLAVNAKPEYEALTAAASATGRKRAVLVGINYVNTRAELRGCVNDVNNMQKVLVEQYGFQMSDIMMINEDQDKSRWPYKKVILEGMQWLYQDAKPGDLLFFHYSGHGSQYQVDKKSMPADCICPLECIQQEWPQSVILDTDIHKNLYDPLPAGCKAVCLFDCCHSATVANLCETMVVKEGPLTEAAKQKLVANLTKQKDALETKVRFFQEVNSGKLDIKKKSREELNELLAKKGFPKDASDLRDDGSGYSYLKDLAIQTLCNESVQKAQGLLDEKAKALAQVLSLKPGEGAQIYIGNLEEDEQEAYKAKDGQTKEVRIRYFPQPQMDTSEARAKPLGTGLRDVLRKEKYTDHQLWVYSGCQDDQTSADAHVEGIYQGAFTWALLKALKADGFAESYRDLLIQIKANLETGRYKQVPALSTCHKMYLNYGFLGVTKFTDQSTPIGHTTLCKARARARENARDEQRRDIHAENLHLASRLKEIVQKPGTLSTAPHSLQREQMREEMLRRDRQIRQKNIQHENRFLVQRLLSVKSSLDVHGLEKDYRRHRNEVGRMQQLRKKLPKLQAPLAEVKSSSRTSGFRPSRQHAALTQSSSAPLLQALPGRLAPSNVPNQAVARSPVSSSIESEAEVNPCLNVIKPREVADATKETDSDGICERRAYQEDVPAYVAALLLRCLALEETPEQAAHEQEQAAPEKAAQEREPAEPEQAEPEHAEPEQAEPEQAEPEQAAQEQEQAEPEQAEPEQAAPEQAAQEQEQAAPEQAAPEQAPGSPAHVFTNLAMEVIHELTSEAPRNTSLAAEVVHDLTADALAALDERAMSTATSWTVQFNSTMESFR
ncbi:unnamed protein product [Effrenium voratum]|nr:unnamed protein product [Effrenium voratum]